MPSVRRFAALALPLIVVATAMPAALASSATAAVSTAKARGNPKAYTFITDDPVARWDPCGGAINYRVNLLAAPKGALNDVKGAIKRVSNATGLKFRYRGKTKAFPAAELKFSGAYPADTHLVIAWAVPGKHSTWMPKKGSRGLAGMAGPSWIPAYTETGRDAAMIVEAGVVLNARMKLKRGFGKGPRSGWQAARGKLLMHEIGHAVGLDHPRIADRWQVMYPTMTRTAAVWGAGDRNGLKRLGAGGCLYEQDPTGVRLGAAARVPAGQRIQP